MSVSVSGPCAYSLISDLVPQDRRVSAYTIYALGVQTGSHISPLNTSLIYYFGWRQTFLLNSLIGFLILGVYAYVLEEPAKGKYDIA